MPTEVQGLVAYRLWPWSAAALSFSWVRDACVLVMAALRPFFCWLFGSDGFLYTLSSNLHIC